ncbi:conserved hypothetical protein [Candidatus Desulfarcum epimagneticum]|uniref:histidine kinase n=1 Tax=uncultured Desulfobacteraceae bacterium TaxID=218296 RepID=A0A484HK24_9BACT|nr:conserved hypothetical protein [uncultured Desulfobacteraceae bacterium]
MLDTLAGATIAFIGGGKFCRDILSVMTDPLFRDRDFKILGVADLKEDAPGARLARERRIFTTTRQADILALDGLEFVVEVTADDDLPERLMREKPNGLTFIDRFTAALLFDSLQVEKKKIALANQMERRGEPPEALEEFLVFADSFKKIIESRHKYSRNIKKRLITSKRQLSQILNGSTAPTFVINKDHVITHWNKALERLSGKSARDMVGTRRQSEPFWGKKRMTMADIILDPPDEKTIRNLYGESLKKSRMIEGSYEAEEFFPSLLPGGRWCFFTAAPIKDPDGNITGAVETLWDRTDYKETEEEKERHYTDIAALYSIYTALDTSLDLDSRINAAAKNIMELLPAETACVFLRDDDGILRLKYAYGKCSKPGEEGFSPDLGIMKKTLSTGKVMIHGDLSGAWSDDIVPFVHLGIFSMAWIPITSKNNRKLGVIRVGSKTPDFFSDKRKNMLDLIGNRLGVAIENSRIYHQYIKSEEKYRSLFDNDPSHIFIMSRDSFAILDSNRRAEEFYGYSKDELAGMSFLDLGSKHKSDERDEEVLAGLEKAGENRPVVFSKKRHYKKNEEPVFVNIHVSRSKYQGEDALIAATTDVTEIVKNENDLIQAGKMSILGTMAAGLAHELNQPLNVIQICSDLLLKLLKKNGDPDRDQLETVAGDIGENVQRAAAIITHMRGFSRQSEGIRTPTDINRPIQDVFKLIGHKLKSNRIHVNLNLQPDLPLIMAEHNRLEQVFLNLVKNSMDAINEKEADMGPGDWEKTISINSFSVKDQVIVEVSDNGVGIPEKNIHKIYEPFFTTKNPDEGTGLGIGISDRIIRDYDGRMIVDSKPGEGTTFILTFPESSS